MEVIHFPTSHYFYFSFWDYFKNTSQVYFFINRSHAFYQCLCSKSFTKMIRQIVKVTSFAIYTYFPVIKIYLRKTEFLKFVAKSRLLLEPHRTNTKITGAFANRSSAGAQRRFGRSLIRRPAFKILAHFP